MLKNSLYITFDGLSDPLGQSQILPYLRGIAAKGYSITILSCEKTDRLYKEQASIQGSIQQLPIRWQWIPYNESGGMLSRLNYLRKLYQLAKKNMAEQPYALVHARSYLAALVALRLKKKFNVSFLFDMRGFWADERMDGDIWQASKPLHRTLFAYFKRQEKKFLRESDAIVSLTHAAVKELEDKHPDLRVSRKTHVIPCCTDTRLFNPTTATPAHVEGISEQDHVLIYTGSIGTWYYTRDMIDCFVTWRHKLPNLKLLIVTRDLEELNNILNTYPQQVRLAIRSLSASYTQIPSLLALAKASIFFIKPAYSKIASSPTKMAECWAMNLPIITNAGIGDNDLYFHTHKGGILLNDFSDKEYQVALEAYTQLASGQNTYRQLALRYFDTSQAITTYTDIYASLFAKKESPAGK